jgi:hypothetical protein
MKKQFPDLGVPGWTKAFTEPGKEIVQPGGDSIGSQAAEEPECGTKPANGNPEVMEIFRMMAFEYFGSGIGYDPVLEQHQLSERFPCRAGFMNDG